MGVSGNSWPVRNYTRPESQDKIGRLDSDLSMAERAMEEIRVEKAWAEKDRF